MGDLFLMAAFLVIGALGYFLMGRLDIFLEENYREIGKKREISKDK